MSRVEAMSNVAQEHLEPVPNVMDRVAIEMRALATVVNDLEALVGNLVIAGAFGTSASLYDLQKLDHLRQSIDGIAEFVEGIGRGSDTAWKVDVPKASSAITLTELCDRLKGTKTFVAPTGDLDFFSNENLDQVA